MRRIGLAIETTHSATVVSEGRLIEPLANGQARRAMDEA